MTRRERRREKELTSTAYFNFFQLIILVALVKLILVLCHFIQFFFSLLLLSSSSFSFSMSKVNNQSTRSVHRIDYEMNDEKGMETKMICSKTINIWTIGNRVIFCFFVFLIESMFNTLCVPMRILIEWAINKYSIQI